MLLQSFDRKAGAYDLVVTGWALANSAYRFRQYPASDGPLANSSFTIEGDAVVGRLTRAGGVAGGVVRSSVWTTGFEQCVGLGTVLLNKDDGDAVETGDRMAIEFVDCAATPSETPTCASFGVDGPNSGLAPVSRTLAGDLTLRN